LWQLRCRIVPHDQNGAAPSRSTRLAARASRMRGGSVPSRSAWRGRADVRRCGVGCRVRSCASRSFCGGRAASSRSFPTEGSPVDSGVHLLARCRHSVQSCSKLGRRQLVQSPVMQVFEALQVPGCLFLRTRPHRRHMVRQEQVESLAQGQALRLRLRQAGFGELILGQGTRARKGHLGVVAEPHVSAFSPLPERQHERLAPDADAEEHAVAVGVVSLPRLGERERSELQIGKQGRLRLVVN
jgi:hypothetical protein